MTDTKHIRELLEKHGGAEAVWESDELFDAIMQELPALLDENDALKECCKEHTECIGFMNEAALKREAEVARLRGLLEMSHDIANITETRIRLQEKYSQQRWIPVGERLPEPPCLLRYRSGIICSGEKRQGNMCEPQPDVIDYRADCCGRFATPVAWMPLPAAPEGE